MAKPVRWTEEEKRQMVIARSQNQHLSWEEFQKNLWPSRTVGALTYMYSEVKRMDRLRTRIQVPEENSFLPSRQIPEHPALEHPPPEHPPPIHHPPEHHPPEHHPPEHHPPEHHPPEHHPPEHHPPEHHPPEHHPPEHHPPEHHPPEHHPPEHHPPEHHPPEHHPPPEQYLAHAPKRTADALKEGEAVCETENSLAQPSHAAKRPCTEDSNGRIQQQTVTSPNGRHSKSTDPQSPEASLPRQNSVQKDSQNVTLDHARQIYPSQSELTQVAQVEEEEEAANGLPLPCSVGEAAPNETLASGLTPARQAEQRTCQFHLVDSLVVNGVENDMADLAMRFCDDISVVRKRRQMVQFQESALSETLSQMTEAFSNTQSILLDLKEQVKQREREAKKAENALELLQKRMENQQNKVISEKMAEIDRLREETSKRNKDLESITDRNEKLERENTSLKEKMKGICALSQLGQF
ncbi:uncharacterized protein TRUGW13939_04736 [Talaromyces rugulosus]|uniref:Uncharacterized protein n=1 Tax=Talaromyces rugulosus TaxID=121627 RepID=A0A7H8QV63_TALRU|nr:uncharacterized protein TRUGW13939_04736 [Talaromyces rugulosus]QKX57618.1 hypothetical protein TRUGW13939_04736 [Talaromyces rugulosus]